MPVKTTPAQKLADATTGGARAVHAGGLFADQLRRYVAKHYSEHGVRVCTQAQLGMNALGGRKRHDILLYRENPETFLSLEAKWQQVRGSVEDKLFRIVTEIREAKTKVPAYVVYGGPGFSQSCRSWLAQQPEALEVTLNNKLTRTMKTQALDEVICRHFGIPLATLLF